MHAILLRVGTATTTGYPLSFFEGDEDSVLARAQSSAAPDATVDLPLDLVAAPVPRITYVDLATARSVLIHADGSDNSLRDLGIQLHALLSRGDVGVRWAVARRTAKSARTPGGGVQLRTYLDVQDPALARLPWELMQDKGDILGLQSWSTVVRYGDAVPPMLDPNELELRVLLVLGCDPAADANIEWQSELRSFLANVCPQRHAVDFEVFEAHTRARGGDLKGALRTAIQSFHPHVLHFIGHGRSENGEGALELFDASTGQVVPWTAQEFKQWLDPAPPRVVLLNACRTSAQAADPAAPIAVLASMSDAARSASVACVIAMQHDIMGKAAARFASGFYAALFNHRPVDVAVVAGREKITDSFGLNERNWALPVCTVSVPPEAVLPPRDRIPVQRRTVVRAHPDFVPLLSFVDRRAQRRSVIAADVSTSSALTFVQSDSGMGKTSLARLLAEWRLLLDHRVIYTDCARTNRQEPLNVVQLLRHLRGPDEASTDLLRPQVYATFATFHDTMNAVLDDKPVGALPADGKDNERALDRNRVTSPRAWDLMFSSYLDALRQLGKERPLTIVLDHLGKQGRGVVFDDFREHIVPRLLAPVHRGEVANVSFMIAATEQEVVNCGLAALRDASLTVRLDDFPIDEWDLLAREFAIRADMNEEVAEMAISTYRAILGNKPWKPRSLLTLKLMYEDAVRGAT